MCSNPCAGPFLRTNMSFFLLSMCAEKLKSTRNNYPTLKDCLFGALTLTKNVDFEKYG